MNNNGLYNRDSIDIVGNSNIVYSIPALNVDKLSAFEQVASCVNPVLTRECEQLKDKIQKLDEMYNALSEYDKRLENTCLEQANEISDLKQQLKEEKVKNAMLKCDSVALTCSGRIYTYDITHFSQEASANDVDLFFDKLSELTSFQIYGDKYLLDCSASIVPIYIMLTKSKSLNKKWEYIGPLNAFCYYWNKNVVGYIDDKERANSLTCDYDNIKAEINKNPWKDLGPSSWRRELDMKTRYKSKLQRAANIKIQMEKLFK